MTKAAKVYWSVSFIIGTLLTILVNGAHAKGWGATPGSWTAVVTAIVPPCLFAALVEGYFIVRRAVPKGVQRLVKWTAGGLALAAFAVSYEASRLFVKDAPGAFPDWVTWVLPGMVDTFVAVSGYVLYVVNEHGSVIAEEPVSSGSTWLSRRLGETDEVRAAKTKLKLAKLEAQTAAVGTVHEHPSLQVGAFSLVGEHVEAKVPEAVVNTETPVHEPFVTADIEVPEAGEAAPEVVPEPSREEFVKRAAAPKKSVRERPAKRQPEVREDLMPYLETARSMLEEKVITRKSEVELAEILKLIDAGNSSYEIRKALGGSTATYDDKLIPAWQDWQSRVATSDRLVSVGSGE